ncbi:hypothetical protein MIR68_008637 [Amoeboaphelidium protococcarum]|nr:hypothetical protein MIR68_008637 [Amoeboaphelidium protococcarum]
MKVLFIHPDLGIGGAERLIVDAAVGLQNLGHSVTVYTSQYDSGHSFPETQKLDIKVRGRLSNPFNGRFMILFAILRQLLLVLSLYFGNELVDVFIVDQLSFCLPLLKIMFPQKPILFYCHYPDMLLTKRSSLIKRIYRAIFDYIESWSMHYADLILCNSRFTQNVVAQTFPSLAQRKNIDILYPAINFSAYDAPIDHDAKDVTLLKLITKQCGQTRRVISLNRFERKKEVSVLIQALFELKNKQDIQLVIAGGYDVKNVENVQHLIELQQLCEQLDLSYSVLDSKQLESADQHRKCQVVFILSYSNNMRQYLLCTETSDRPFLAYTPIGEHFGIVPIESMYRGVPVIAFASGGPLETVKDEKSGFLCRADGDSAESRSQTLYQKLESCLALSADRYREISTYAQQYAKSDHSLVQFAKKLDAHLQRLLIKND